jgi:ribonuclease P protein component
MAREAHREGYSRRHRFSVQGSFGVILRGSRKLRGRLAILHVAPGQPGASRLGIALTRRLVPRSVDRNRVKRLVRDTFRRHVAKRAGFDCVVSLRERFDAAKAEPLFAEIRILFDQLAITTPPE